MSIARMALAAAVAAGLIAGCASKPAARKPAVAAAQKQAAAKKPAESATTPDRSRLVCFTEPTTGSHMKKRICGTETEMAARRQADQERMQNLQRRGAANQGSSAGR